MQTPILNLVVIRTEDIDSLAAFYSAIGFEFEKHRHGSGPEHYASENGGAVFEIYPIGKGVATTGTRIGFRVSSVDESVTAATSAGGSLLSKAQDSEWGSRAVVLDPAGHKVELVGERLL
jgi:lactoylglutathione lyase